MSNETNYCICIVPMKSKLHWYCDGCGNEIKENQPDPNPNPREITMDDIDRMEKEISYLKAQLQIASEQRDNAIHLFEAGKKEADDFRELSKAQAKGLDDYSTQYMKCYSDFLDLSGQYEMSKTIIGRLRDVIELQAQLIVKMIGVNVQG